jgi:hypothetical protein
MNANQILVGRRLRRLRNGWIILKWILDEQGGVVCARLNWLKLKTSGGGVYETRKGPWGSIKCCGVPGQLNNWWPLGKLCQIGEQNISRILSSNVDACCVPNLYDG